MALDLAALDLQAEAESGATMQVLHPKTGAKTGATCSVIGAEGPSYRAALRELRDAALANPEREPTDEDSILLLGRARSAAAALTGWSGIAEGGDEVAFDRDAAVEVLTRYPWLADQILTFAGTRGNFGRG